MTQDDYYKSQEYREIDFWLRRTGIVEDLIWIVQDLIVLGLKSAERFTDEP